MKLISFVPVGTKFDFIGKRVYALAFSAALVLLSLGFFFTQGLNYGIDFRGGTLVDVRMPEAPNLSDLRRQLSGLGLGDINLQTFGQPNDILIRIQQQEGAEGAEGTQAVAVEKVKDALGPGMEYRRVEYVGPKVGDELIRDGITAVVLALAAMMVYIWFRFEWQFGLCAVIALIHDVVTTIGIFSILQFEFNLSTVAAILTIAGYSINDTVVIYDRVRENLRKYKKLPLAQLLNQSSNDTLSRTLLTSGTTLLALIALYYFGGEVIRGFVFAMIWGVLVGTYSSVFVAVPLLLYLNIRREAMTGEAVEQPAPGGER